MKMFMVKFPFYVYCEHSSTGLIGYAIIAAILRLHQDKDKHSFRMNESGKLIAVIGDEDTVTGFVLAGVGHRTVEGQNFLVVKSGSYNNNKFYFICINDFN